MLYLIISVFLFIMLLMYSTLLSINKNLTEINKKLDSKKEEN